MGGVYSDRLVRIYSVTVLLSLLLFCNNYNRMRSRLALDCLKVSKDWESEHWLNCFQKQENKFLDVKKICRSFLMRCLSSVECESCYFWTGLPTHLTPVTVSHTNQGLDNLFQECMVLHMFWKCAHFLQDVYRIT